MSLLSKLLGMSRSELKSTVQSLDTSAVKGRGLRRRFERIRNKQGGFTLLELLVVVAILAAIAGTATIMLQDTDRKQAAGAHVAMMDELSKGIQTFRVLNKGKYPDVWDSLFQNSVNDTEAAGADLKPLEILSVDLAGELGFTAKLGANLAALNTVGITQVRVLDDSSSCGATRADQQAYINNKGNDVTPQNIYRTRLANGCGFDAHHELTADSIVARWSGNLQRIGVPLGSATAADNIVAFGIGPDSTLFDPSIIGALSNVPVYRHVEQDEYNRFIVLFNTISGEATFQAIIDGAGDTKDEELGELDNVRTTL